MRGAWALIRNHFPTAGARGYATLGCAALAAGAGLLTATALSGVALSATSTMDTLAAGATLAAGQQIISPDGHYALTMEPNGDLVEQIAGGRTLWTTATSGHPSARAIMQVNGNLVVYDAASSAVWSSNSAAATGCPRLVIQQDGNVVIYTAKAIWSSASRDDRMLPGDVLESGWSLYSVGPEAYRLRMLADGNLALFDGSGNELWSTATYGHAGAYASMQTDGNLVVYSSSGHALWSSATSTYPGSHLDMMGDGNVDIIHGSTVVWRSHTYHKGSGVLLAPVAPPPVACPAPVSPAPPTTTTVTTPGPVVTVPVTVPVPQPTPRPRALRVKLAISWTWNRATTRLRKVRLGSFPGRTRLLVQCQGRGCPRHRKVTASGPRAVRRLVRGLAGRRFRAGDRLLITLTAPGYRSERAEIDFRWGKLPRASLLRGRPEPPRDGWLDVVRVLASHRGAAGWRRARRHPRVIVGTGRA